MNIKKEMNTYIKKQYRNINNEDDIFIPSLDSLILFSKKSEYIFFRRDNDFIQINKIKKYSDNFSCSEFIEWNKSKENNTFKIITKNNFITYIKNNNLIKYLYIYKKR